MKAIHWGLLGLLSLSIGAFGSAAHAASSNAGKTIYTAGSSSGYGGGYYVQTNYCSNGNVQSGTVHRADGYMEVYYKGAQGKACQVNVSPAPAMSTVFITPGCTDYRQESTSELCDTTEYPRKAHY